MARSLGSGTKDVVGAASFVRPGSDFVVRNRCGPKKGLDYSVPAYNIKYIIMMRYGRMTRGVSSAAAGHPVSWSEE